MSKTPRTFKLPSKPKPGKKPEPLMRGDDIKAWQVDVKKLFKQMGIDCPIVIDGVYAQQSRGFSAALVRAMGLSVKKAMANGVTPELRIKLRNRDLTKAQLETKNSKARKEYRAKLREQWKPKKVHAPVAKIIDDSWDYHPGLHDGIDVLAPEGVTAYAMVKSKVIDVRPHGWWNLGAPSNKALKERGDGIVQLEVLETVGPLKKGMHIGYGHCVHPRVKKGQIVEAGHPLALVGFANAGHIHLMFNDGSTTKGVGNIDPRRMLDYSVKHG